jgi:competence protein ComFC
VEKIASLLFGSEELCPLCGVEERSSTERCCTVCEGKLEFVEGFWDDEKLQCHYFFFYNNFLRELVHDMKFHRQNHLAAVFGGWIADCLAERKLLDVDAIVYVPMASSEEKRRGYNQAKLMAEEISRRTGILLLDVLKKKRATTGHSTMTAYRRVKNVHGAYVVEKPEILKGRRILIVDDLVTTGATLSEIKRVLEAARPRSLRAVALASPRGLQGHERSEDGTA